MRGGCSVVVAVGGVEMGGVVDGWVELFGAGAGVIGTDRIGREMGAGVGGAAAGVAA